MGFRSIFYTEIDRFDANAIVPAEVYTVVWQLGPFITGTWPGSTPAAPTTTFDMNAGGASVHIHIGFVAAGALGTVTIEIQLNGTTVETFTVVDPTNTNYEFDYYNNAYPSQDLYSAGDQFTILVTNGSAGVIEMNNDEVEAPLLIQVDQYFIDTPITPQELCPEVFVTQPGAERIPSYDSSDLCVSTEYDPTDGDNDDYSPRDLAFKANEDDFVVTLYNGDLDRSITLPFTRGTVDPTAAPTNRSSLIDPGNNFAVEIDHDDNIFLLGYKDSDLRLHKFNAAGVLQWSEIVDSAGVPGVALCLDIASDGKAYYTECGTAGVVAGKSYLYCFNTNTQTQEPPALTLDRVFASRPDSFGGFRLLLDNTIGGCAINRFERIDAAPDYDSIWVDVYDRNAILLGRIPVQTHGTSNLEPSCALCFGEDSDKIWIGKQNEFGSETGNIYKYDLNTFAQIASIIDSNSDYNGGIKSCTAEEGVGFGGVVQRMPVIVTLFGAT